jgi:tetratricopeptide (TPR) repeat protein
MTGNLKNLAQVSLFVFLSICCFAPLPPAQGADWDFPFPEEWPEQDGDQLGLFHQAVALRISRDPVKLLEFNREIHQSARRDQWSLFMLARNAVRVHGRVATLEGIENRDLEVILGSPAEDDSYPEATWELFRAITEWTKGRARTCATILAELEPDHPEWGRLIAYMRWYICDEIMLPLDEESRYLEQMTGDSISLSLALETYLTHANPDESDRLELEAFLDKASAHPVTDLLKDLLVQINRWENEDLSLDQVSDQWKGFQERNGDLAFLHADVFYRYLTSHFRCEELLPLLKRWSRHDLGTDFTIGYARELQFLGEDLQSLKVMSRVGDYSPYTRGLEFELTGNLAPADKVRELAIAIHDDILAPSSSRSFQEELLNLGEDELWRTTWEELSRENPHQVVEHRLENLLMEDPKGFQALCDSVRALGVNPRWYDVYFKQQVALESGKVDLAAIRAERDRDERSEMIRRGYAVSTLNGNAALRDSLLFLQIELSEFPCRLRNDVMWSVFSGNKEAVKRAIEKLDELGEDWEAGLEFRLLGQLLVEGEEEARRSLEDLSINMINQARTVEVLARICRGLELKDLEEEATLRLEALAPGSMQARWNRALFHQNRGDFPAAEAILRQLAEDYPGNQHLQEFLMEFGDSVVSLDRLQPDRTDSDKQFADFGYELDNPELARSLRAVDTDSLQSDTVGLLQRRSLVLSDLDYAHERHHRVVQILTRAGAEAWRTYTFGFNPYEGVPTVRCARVFTPDGKVHETDPSTMLVRAPEDEDVDVSDRREMVIPLQGVEPGAIIEVAYDSRLQSSFSDLWSKHHFFYAGMPIREYVFELKVPQELEFFTVINGEVEEEETGLPGVSRWVMRDVDLKLEEESGPDVSEILPWVGITTSSSWQEVGKRYAEEFWTANSPSPRVRAVADSLCAGLSGKQAKTEALYAFVVEEINPLLVELGRGRLIPSTGDEVLLRGWGDCKDVSNLLISLLAAVDVDAQPVLVSTRGYLYPKKEFPSLQFFDHMIVRITGLKGKPYCDPLNGTECLDYLPASNAGRPGLHLPVNGNADLAVLPDLEPEDIETRMIVDIEPVGRRALSYRIHGTFTGDMARYIEGFTSFGDTNITRQLLDHSVGYGVPGGVPIQSWSVNRGDCGQLEVAMSYLDTAWTEEGAHVGQLRHLNELSKQWELPSYEDRTLDVILPAPYKGHLQMTLHGNEFWSPDSRVVPFSVANDFCRGEIRGGEKKVGGKKVVRIEHDFELRDHRIPVDKYKAFQQDALAFYMFSAQSYDYRQALDRDRLKSIEEYAEQNMQDQGFLLNAAASLLGSDLGGPGEEGDERRALAMRLLKNLSSEGSIHPQASYLIARIHIRNTKYLQALATIEAALKENPEDIYLRSLQLDVLMELDRWPQVAEGLAELSNTYGSASLAHQYARVLLIIGDEEGAQQQFDRMALLGSPVTKRDELLLRADVADRQNDLEAMRAIRIKLDELSTEEDENIILLCREYELQENREEVLPLYERMLAEDPSNPFLCNNLAWNYALAGKNLDRALMLARVAMLMAGDPTASRNTYATILARQGEWKEARSIFKEMYENDDRPSSRLVNGYFLGLAEASLGNEERALEIWEGVKDIDCDPWAREKLAQSRAALEAGGDFTKAVFGN